VDVVQPNDACAVGDLAAADVGASHVAHFLAGYVRIHPVKVVVADSTPRVVLVDLQPAKDLSAAGGGSASQYVSLRVD